MTGEVNVDKLSRMWWHGYEFATSDVMAAIRIRPPDTPPRSDVEVDNVLQFRKRPDNKRPRQ